MFDISIIKNLIEDPQSFSIFGLKGDLTIYSDLFSIFPELCLCLAMFITLLMSLNKNAVKFAFISNSFFSLIGLVFCILLFLQIGPKQNFYSFNGAFVLDSFALLLKGLILLVLLSLNLVANFFQDSRSSDENKLTSRGEFQFLLLGASLGAIFLVSSNDLILLFVALETLGLSSIALVGFLKNDSPNSNSLSGEASIKYLLNSAIASACFLFALSLIYGLSFGNTNFSVFPTLMAQAKMLGSVAQIFPFVIFTISLILLVCSIAVKLSLAPFHFWAPDVYNGASLPVTTFLATASKVAAFGIFCRIGWNIFSFNQATFMLWNSAFALLAILSMIVGNLTGARQIFRSNGSIKRLLAYSSIAQIGYVLTGAVLGTDWSLGQSLFYLIMYIVTNLALFIGIIKFESILVKRDIKSIHPDNIDALKGLFKIKPKLAIFLALCLANLGGILPFMLIAKFILIDASVHASLSGNALSSVLPFDLVTKLNLDKIPFAVNPWISLLMAATLILTSIVALFYYSTLIKKMFVDEPLPEILDKAKAREENYSFSAGNFVGNLVINFVCVALLIGSISFSIFPNFWASQVSTFSAQSLIVSSSNTLDVIVRK